MLAQIASWKKELPTIKPYYAVKSNPDTELLKMLAASGAGFDCASAKEIELVKGIGSDEIVFANPCKTFRDIESGKRHSVTHTVVDSVEEVDKLVHSGWKEKLLVRIAVEDSDSLCRFSSKFGASLDEVPAILDTCKKHTIPVDGISFHVGSGCMNPMQYEWALKNVYSILGLLGKTQPIVDIGGGFLPESFPEMAQIIRKNLIKGPLYIAEPGRFFSMRSQDLYTKIIGKKPGVGGKGWRYTIDESLYGQFSNIAFDHAKPVWSILGADVGLEARRKGKGVIFGRTCDSLDIIEESDDMPELFEGDWLHFPNMGAYTGVTASEFNGFPKPAIMYE